MKKEKRDNTKKENIRYSFIGVLNMIELNFDCNFLPYPKA